MYEHLLQLDTLNINFDRFGAKLIGLFIAFVMYGVALGMRPLSFKMVFYKPRPLFIGLLCQWLFFPLITFIAVVLLKDFITPMVAMGLLLVASCPGGVVSNFMVSHSKGNTELAVLMSTITTLAAPIFTPLNFAIWGGFYVKYFAASASSVLMTLSVPVDQIFITVIGIIGIPVLLGLITAKYAPGISAKLKMVMRYLSIICFVVIVIMLLLVNYQLFRKYIGYVFVIVLVHNILALAVGYTASAVGGLSIKDRRTVTLGTGIQNTALGLLLLSNHNIFPQELANGGMAFVVAWWGVWHIISGLIVSSGFRLSKARRKEI